LASIVIVLPIIIPPHQSKHLFFKNRFDNPGFFERENLRCADDFIGIEPVFLICPDAETEIFLIGHDGMASFASLSQPGAIRAAIGKSNRAEAKCFLG
jgi:hypothetical protein